jgi:hypothetical protein
LTQSGSWGLPPQAYAIYANRAPTSLGSHLQDNTNRLTPNRRDTIGVPSGTGYGARPLVRFCVLSACCPSESGNPGFTSPGTFRPWAFSSLRRFTPQMASLFCFTQATLIGFERARLLNRQSKARTPVLQPKGDFTREHAPAGPHLVPKTEGANDTIEKLTECEAAALHRTPTRTMTRAPLTDVSQAKVPGGGHGVQPQRPTTIAWRERNTLLRELQRASQLVTIKEQPV